MMMTMSSRWVARPPGWLSDALKRDPIRCIDVGARGGFQRKWRAYDEHVIFVGFEPDAAECERLRAQAKSNEIYVDKALHHSVAVVPLYICDPPTLTSLYRPDLRVFGRLFGRSSKPRITHVEEIAVTTLDLAMEPLGLGTIDFIKLDTQGSELDILRGAERTLADPLLAIQVEVEFTPLYEDQPLFADVATFLRSHGFESIDFEALHSAAWMRFMTREGHSSEGMPTFLRSWGGLVATRGGLRGGQRLIYGDALFMREPHAWISAVERCADPRAVGLRGLMTACILGYYEQALEFADRLRDANRLSAVERDEVAAFIDAGQRTFWRAASDLARASSRLAHRLRHLGRGD
jgi:FkbM family methyltransferase